MLLIETKIYPLLFFLIVKSKKRLLGLILLERKQENKYLFLIYLKQEQYCQ